MGAVKFEMLQVGMLGTNCYIVYDDATLEGYIIDPGGDSRTVLDLASRIGLVCRGVLCTHGHMDHVGAVGKVAEATGSTVYISERDSGILDGTARGLKDRLGSLVVSKPRGVELIGAGDSLPFGEHQLEVLATPGHTKGSLSFLADKLLFCGDLVFQGSVGRTDLRGGSMEELLDSVRREVFTLPPDARIMPGHGPDTTVDSESATNPFLRGIRGGR